MYELDGCWSPNATSKFSQEISLRATQYISDIVKLQQFLHDKFNHRLYQSEAIKKTIGDIQETLRGNIFISDVCCIT